MKLVSALLLGACLQSLLAQSSKIDLYTAGELTKQEQLYRGKVDAKTGSVGRVLKRYPNHSTMLVLRERDGESELHQDFADLFIVVDGKAELWTGGKMQNARQTDQGEQRGSGLVEAAHVLISKGDIVHIPAGVPHQVRVTKGMSITYFVLKASEKRGTTE